MIVTIEGNIGAGKSTLLKLCENLELCKPHIIVQEDVDAWTSMTDETTGKSIFDLFYQDKEKYSYVFQTYVLFSRIDALAKVIQENPDTIILCERSFMTDFEIFAKTLYDSGMFSEIEWAVYVKWHEMARNLFNHPIRGQIYLRADPETCFIRISQRNRQSEHLIQMDYLSQLHQKHEDWLITNNKGKNAVPTFVVDGNENYDKIMNNKKMIEDFVNSISSS
jgi:deoxyadenosine/deoxycytidine kinase